ncbi:glycosyltransferase [Candidatus Nomurabacteria bacterium]|nr:glycosyltransferase [Candidatus Nomurabacteria bacterium]
MDKKFDVIMFNMSSFSEWEEGVSNRNYHVLQQLLQNDQIGKILAVDYLPLNFKRALRNYKENVALNLKKGQVIKKRPTYKVTKISEKLYVYSDVNFFLSPKFTLANIKKTALELNFGDIITWSFFPFIALHQQEFGQKLSIFEAVDNWLNHSSYQKYQDKLKQAYKLIEDQADLIFTVSPNLVHFFGDQANVYWIPNGVDLKHYSQKFSLINRDIADIPKPIIGYIGVIQDRVDLKLIEYLAKENPKKSIVLVGPVWNEQDQAKKALDLLDNVYFLGYKSYQEAPMYIQQFDLGIIPHTKLDFSSSTNPMKMYEYLACGKPVVASQGAGTENVENMIAIAKDQEDFNLQVNDLLKNDNQELQKQRQEYVKKHSWISVVNKMMDLVNKKIG